MFSMPKISGVLNVHCTTGLKIYIFVCLMDNVQAVRVLYKIHVLNACTRTEIKSDTMRCHSNYFVASMQI